MNLTEKIVLGTAQFGMDYGIANISGKPAKKEVFRILGMAWEKGVKRFDTAPLYGSEELLGEFITVNGLHDEVIVLTKIPSLVGLSDYDKFIRTSLESSLDKLGCSVEVLFFHDALDAVLLQKNPQFFEKLFQDYPISTLGVSVYEPQEVERLSGSKFELAFQFPFNVLDRRFEQVTTPQGKRYARSVFLQGLLASKNGLIQDAPDELYNLQKEYFEKLNKHHLDPVSFAVSFAAYNDVVDYLLIGVDSVQQMQDILDIKPYEQKDMVILDTIQVITEEKWLDPRTWN